MPFLVDDEYAGAVGFDTFHAERSFDQAVVSALEIAASVIGAALHRVRLVDAVRRERELAAEQRCDRTGPRQRALRTNLERLASHPTEFFTHLLLETVRHAGAEAATAVASGYESDDWLVALHSRDGRISEAEFRRQHSGTRFGLHAADADTARAAAPAAAGRAALPTGRNSSISTATPDTAACTCCRWCSARATSAWSDWAFASMNRCARN